MSRRWTDGPYGIPLYVQLRNHLKSFILNGTLGPGQRMPGVRQLAQYLGINRHTVSRAFHELESLGLVVVERGRGTFVTAGSLPPVMLAAEQLRAIAMKAIVESECTGFTAQELASAILHEAANREHPEHDQIRIAFIECNPISLSSYATDLERDLGVHVETILMGNLRKDMELGVDPLAGCDILVTTIGHSHEVRRIIGTKKEIHTVSIGPYMQVFLAVLALPDNLQIGIVTAGELGSRGMEQALVQAGIAPGRLRLASMERSERIEEIIHDSDVLVVSSAAMATVSACGIPPGVHIIEYQNKLDLTSVEALREVIRDVRAQKKAEVADSDRVLSLADLQRALVQER